MKTNKGKLRKLNKDEFKKYQKSKVGGRLKEAGQITW